MNHYADFKRQIWEEAKLHGAPAAWILENADERIAILRSMKHNAYMEGRGEEGNLAFRHLRAWRRAKQWAEKELGRA